MQDLFNDRRCCARARRFLFFSVKSDGSVNTKKPPAKAGGKQGRRTWI